jgi:hypothetical protein
MPERLMVASWNVNPEVCRIWRRQLSSRVASEATRFTLLRAASSFGPEAAIFFQAADVMKPALRPQITQFLRRSKELVLLRARDLATWFRNQHPSVLIYGPSCLEIGMRKTTATRSG